MARRSSGNLGRGSVARPNPTKPRNRPGNGGGPAASGGGRPGSNTARVPQTEKNAKGLISGVGDYAGRTLNLTAKQLRAAGVAKPGQMRTVNISSTTYDSTAKRVMGPAGKPLTGRVDLGGGNFAVYVEGRRVRAPRPGGGTSRPSTASATGSTTGGSSGTSDDNVTVPPAATPPPDKPKPWAGQWGMDQYRPMVRPPAMNPLPVDPNRPSVSSGLPTPTTTPSPGSPANNTGTYGPGGLFAGPYARNRRGRGGKRK